MARIGDMFLCSKHFHPFGLSSTAAYRMKAEFQRLSALGVVVTLRPWGTCDGVDPEGNVFQICSATT